ncbi:hypothetical protein BGW41_008376 [Actinomortierella wolfii]|nr:hypothetical protein BGW41_008376 [Actinomortierella wolfii]
MSSVTPTATNHHNAQLSPIDPPSVATTTNAHEEVSGHIVFKKVHVPLSYPPPPGALKLQSDIITVFPPPKPAESQMSPTMISPPPTPSSLVGGGMPSSPGSATARRSFEALEQQHRMGGSMPSIQRNSTCMSMATQGTAGTGGSTPAAATPIRRRSSGRVSVPPGRMASMPNLSSSAPGLLSSSLPNLSALPTPVEEEQEQGENCVQQDDNFSRRVSALPNSSATPARPPNLTIQGRRASVSSLSSLHQHHQTQNHHHQNNNATTSTSTTDNHAQSLPSPPDSPWIKSRRPSMNSKLNRAATMFVASSSPASAASATSHHDPAESDIPYPDLPTNVRSWTSSHVATYLCYILRFYPRTITEDLARHVRQTACLNGEDFLNIQDDDLARMGINQKWRQLIMEGVRALRRETFRMTRSMDGMRWEDGFDPLKDKTLPPSLAVNEGDSLQESRAADHTDSGASPPPVKRFSYYDEDDNHTQTHSRMAGHHVDVDQEQERHVDDEDDDSDDADEVDLDQFQKELEYRHDGHDGHQHPYRSHYHDADDTEPGFGYRLQGLKKSFISSVTSLTNMFPDQQQQQPSTKTVIDGDDTTLLERVGFVEGVVVGGIAVACLMKLVR